MKLKMTAAAALVGALLLTPQPVSAVSSIIVNIDGDKVDLAEKPVIRDDTTFVPLRLVSEKLGAAVTWDDATRSVTIVKGDVTNVMTLDSKTASKWKNGNKETAALTVTLASPPVLLNGTTFVPLRYIAESLGALVDWEESRNTGIVSIVSPKKLVVGDKTVTLGESLKEVTARLGTADRIEESLYAFKWHVYKKDYTTFLMVGIDDNDTVRGLYTNSRLFRYNDEIGYGDLNVTAVKGGTLFLDKYEQNKVHAILIAASKADNNKFAERPEIRTANELDNWDATNAFRANYGLKPLGYDDIAASTARGHSQDMADQNYFSHTALDGRSPWDRYKDNNGPYFGSGENISAGRVSGLESFNGWLNSEGHRKNMLSESHTRMGVGAGYNPKSQYSYYYTQFFSTAR